MDLGAHDGRWCFAALMVGARHVTGIEARQHLVAKAMQNFADHSVDASRYQFVVGDALDQMRRLPSSSFDVAMCLGFFYHTMDHVRLLLEARRLGIRTIIVDTGITGDPDSLIRLRFESVADTRNAVDYAKAGAKAALVGMPSESGLRAMLTHVGYSDIEFFNWHDGVVRSWRDIEDYQNNQRITVRACTGLALSSP